MIIQLFDYFERVFVTCIKKTRCVPSFCPCYTRSVPGSCNSCCDLSIKKHHLNKFYYIQMVFVNSVLTDFFSGLDVLAQFFLIPFLFSSFADFIQAVNLSVKASCKKELEKSSVKSRKLVHKVFWCK